LQNAYSSLGYVAGDYPVSERVADHIVSLPIFPQMTHAQQARVIEEIVNFVHSRDTSKDVFAHCATVAIAERAA